MTKTPKLTTQKKRLACAVCIVVCLLLTLLFGKALSCALAPPSDTGGKRAQAGGIDAAAVTSTQDIDELLNSLDEMSDTSKTGSMASFEEEVGFLSGARDIRLSDTDSSSHEQIISYVIDRKPEDTLSDLNAHMESRGFTSVPLGEAQGATFIKDSGEFRWILATISQIESSSVVVLRSVEQ